MALVQHSQNSVYRLFSLAVVIALHLLLLLLIEAQPKPQIDLQIDPPLQMQIIQELIIEPAPVQPSPPIQPKVPPPVKAKPIQPKVEIPKVESPPVAEPITTPPPEMAPSPTVTAPPVQEATPKPIPAQTHGVTGNAAANCPEPAYPQDALMNEEQGLVKLRLEVGSNGRVSQAQILKSSGSKSLDRATTSAYKRCVFQAAMQNGVAVAGSIDLEYQFKIE